MYGLTTHAWARTMARMAAISGLICTCACHVPNGEHGSPFGCNLPGSEAEFLAMGDALLDLDRQRIPLKRLDDLAGDWIIEARFHSWKNAPATELRMISENMWILGKRCLQCRYQYTIPGETIADLYILSWDPISKEYGIDAFSSGWPLPSRGTGHWDADRQSLQFVLKTTNPSNKEPITTLYCLSDIRPNSHRWIQYRSGDDGELVPILTMLATRAPPP